MKFFLILMVVSITTFSAAATEVKNKVESPHCKAILDICKKAGFVGKDWRNGNGLYIHCVHQIIGIPTAAKASVLKMGLIVPSVAPSEVQACLAENPFFGQNKVSENY